MSEEEAGAAYDPRLCDETLRVVLCLLLALAAGERTVCGESGGKRARGSDLAGVGSCNSGVASARFTLGALGDSKDSDESDFEVGMILPRPGPFCRADARSKRFSLASSARSRAVRSAFTM